jgi:hypothetical protein
LHSDQWTGHALTAQPLDGGDGVCVRAVRASGGRRALVLQRKLAARPMPCQPTKSTSLGNAGGGRSVPDPPSLLADAPDKQGSSALLLRIMRASMIEVLSSEYIRTALAKGATRGRVIWGHAMRNALIPFLTVGAVEFSLLFGGVVIIENIFLLPGVGALALIGIVQRDYPVLLASVLLIATVVLSANLVVDLIAAWLDPRRVHRASHG